MPSRLFAAVMAALSVTCLAAAERPAWMREEGVIAASDMESLTFVLRRGGGPVNAVEQWHAQRTEETVRRFRDLGINLVITNFHKGAGLRAEAEDMEATRRFTELAHRYGIKVAGYVGSSLMYETFLLEEPSAKDWIQVDEFGHPIYYTADQTFRYMACRNNPGYLAFLRKLIRIGIVDYKLDLLHFDQLQWWPEPYSCRCRHCRALFREFLRQRYGDAARARLRFGFSDFDAVIPPPYNLPAGPPVRLTELRNPMMQEWALFRAATIARRFAEFEQYARSLNPAAGVIGNPTMNQESNVGFIYGVDPGQLFAHGAGIWTEEPNLPVWTADGRVVSQIRSYKAARAMGQTLFHWQDLTGYAAYRDAPRVLRLAEALAYNDMNMGVLAGGDAGGNDPPEVVRRYVQFFREHRTGLRDTVPVADAVVLCSFASNQFDPSRANAATVLFEQALIQSRIPWGMAFDSTLARLRPDQVLVLADQDALSDAQIQIIRKHVEQGGGVVATGRTSALTEWRTVRERLGLPGLSGSGGAPTHQNYGKGRVAYVPQIEAARDFPPAQMTFSLRNTYWQLPRNASALTDAVRWAAGHSQSADVEAPAWVTAELSEQSGTRNRLLHLVNFKIEEPVRAIPVRIRIPEGLKLRSATLESPDGIEARELEFAQSGGSAAFQVPELRVYDLVQLRFDKRLP